VSEWEVQIRRLCYKCDDGQLPPPMINQDGSRDCICVPMEHGIRYEVRWINLPLEDFK
jgi:hypothetical protein